MVPGRREDKEKAADTITIQTPELGGYSVLPFILNGYICGFLGEFLPGTVQWW